MKTARAATHAVDVNAPRQQCVEISPDSATNARWANCIRRTWHGTAWPVGLRTQALARLPLWM